MMVAKFNPEFMNQIEDEDGVMRVITTEYGPNVQLYTASSMSDVYEKGLKFFDKIAFLTVLQQRAFDPSNPNKDRYYSILMSSPYGANNTVLNKETYEMVNGPDHYDGNNCLIEMETAFGKQAVHSFCVCNAWKYRYRAGRKPGEEAEQDEAKAKFYMEYAKKLMK